MISDQIGVRRRYRLQSGAEAYVFAITRRPGQSLPEAAVTWVEHVPGERSVTRSGSLGEFARMAREDITRPVPPGPPEAA